MLIVLPQKPKLGFTSPGHSPPGMPNVFLTPFMGKIVDLTSGMGVCNVRVVRGRDVDRRHEEGEVVCCHDGSCDLKEWAEKMYGVRCGERHLERR